MRTLRNNTKNKIFHVYSRGFQKHKIFRSNRDYTHFASLVREACKIFKIELYAFCIMPNHIHLLIQGTEEGELSRFMHRICFRYAQYYNSKYHRTGKVWHDRYKSKVVDEGNYFKNTLEYIEENPVRAKFVKRKELWPYSSATQPKKSNQEQKLSKLQEEITAIHEAIKKLPYYISLEEYKIPIKPPPL